MRRDGDDPVIDAALAELIGGQAAPDLTARILARASQLVPNQLAEETLAPVHRLPAWRGRLFLGLELLAAAAVISVVAWLVWFSDKAPANHQAEVDRSLLVTPAPGADFEWKDGAMILHRGWMLLETGAPVVRAVDTTISDVNGSAILKVGGVPTSAELDSMRPWLIKKGVNETMLNNRRWFAGKSIALCVLTGTLLANGTLIRAEDDNPIAPDIEEEEHESRDRSLATNAKQLEALDDDVTDLICLRMKDEELGGLRRLTKLRSLSFVPDWAEETTVIPPDPPITDKGLEIVAEIGSLRHLNLTECRGITSAGVAKLARLPRLEALNLARVPLDAALIKSLADFPGLHELDFEDARYDGANQAEDFKPLAKIATLRSLGLVSCHWLNDAAMACIGQCVRIEDLNLMRCLNFGDEGVRALAPLTNLRELRLGSMSTIRVHPKEVRPGSTSEYNCVECSSASLVAALKNKPALRLLVLDTMPGVDNDVLGAIGDIGALADLNLHHCCNIGDEGVAHLVELRRLEALNLSFCGALGDAAMEALGRIGSLRALDLSGKFSTGGEMGFSGKYEWMNKRYLRVSDKGLQSLSTLTGLRELSLASSNTLTETGLNHLAAFINVQELDLTDVGGMTDAVVESTLSKLTNLEHLKMNGCNELSEAIVPHLGKLKNLRTLSIQFYFYGRGDKFILTDDAVKQLKKLVPMVQVVN